MKKLVPVLFIAATATAWAQLQNPQGGIFGVTRRTPMIIPQIQANQFFAAGGVYVVTPGGAGPNALQGQPLNTQVTGPLADNTPAPAAVAPKPVIVYRPVPRLKPTPPTGVAVIRSHWEGAEPAQPATPAVAAAGH